MNTPAQVLFIEDNPGDARLVREELSQNGQTFTTRLTWVDRLDLGLEHLRASQVDAVLLDLSLPDSHGLDTLKCVLQAAPVIPVIVMTGTADETIALQAVQAGAQDYLIKGQVGGGLLARAIRYAIGRKQVELQLRELAAIVEHSEDVIFRKDLDGTIRSWNRGAEQVYGYRPEEVIGRSISILIPPEHRNQMDEIMAQLKRGEKVEHFETERLRKDGTRISILLKISPIRDNQGNIIAASVLARDITEKKRAEEALKNSEMRLNNILANAAEAIIVVNEQEEITLFNRFAQKEFGWSEVEILGKPLSLLIPRRFAEIHHKHIRNFSRSSETTRDMESHQMLVCVRKDGSEFISTIGISKHLEDGRMFFTAIVQDITENKRTEEAVQQMRDRFQALTEHAPDGVALVGISGQMQFVSPAGRQMFGYSQMDEIRIDPAEHTHPEDLPQVLSALATLTEDPSYIPTLQYRFRHKDGSWRWIESTFTNLLEVKSVEAVVINFRDITDRREAEKKIAFQADLLSAVGSAVIATDLAGHVIYWNRAADAIYGWTASEALGRQITDLTPAQQTKEKALEIMDHMRRGQPWSGDFLVRSRDGRMFPAFVSNSPLLDENGTLTGIIGVSSDITERKQAEQALSRSERRFRALIENNADAIALLGKDGTILFESPAAIRILGFEVDELVGCNALELLHPEDLPAAAALLAELIQTPMAVTSTEVRFRRKDGSFCWVEATGSNLLEEESVQAIVVNYRDITGRTQDEEKIRQQLRRLNILRKIDRGITGSVSLNAVLEIILKEGMAELGVDAAVVLLYDPGQQLLKYELGIGMRTAALQHTQLKPGEGYAGRAAQARQTLFIADLQERTTDFLRSPIFSLEGFACYFGVPLVAKDEIKGVLEIFHRTPLEPQQEWLDFMETLAGQAAIAIDNAQLWQRFQRQNLELEGRVAERTAELNQANLELEHANRAKDEFLATMSHELRTPLNSILGLSESLLEQRRDPLSEYQQGSLRIIETSGRHLLDLINDILDLSKIEAGKLDYYPQVVDMHALCRASLTFIKEQAMRKSISLVYTEKHAEVKILADPRRLKQALVNLLSNAIKFTPEHGQVTLEVQADPEEDRVRFTVTDTGIGIAEKDLELLFQPFVQVDSSLNRQYEGTGLGLVLVERLTDLHGGSVQVESKPEQGSRFTISIPWRQQVVAEQEIIESGGELPARKTHPGPPAPARDVTVLLAEDNAANTLMISEYLESYGYRVVNACDGLDAIEKAEADHPHIILMDIQMPAMDGLEATRRMRTNPHFASTPVIALTALAMPGDRERCLKAGADEYMSKPVSLKMLVNTIESLLQNSRK